MRARDWYDGTGGHFAYTLTIANEEVDVEVNYTYIPGTPPSGYMNCDPSMYDPGSGPEIIIERVTRGGQDVKIDEAQRAELEEWIMDREAI